MAVTLIKKSQLRPLNIVDADVAAGAAIATSKLADGANFLKKDGSVAMTGALQMGTNKITGLGTPTAGTDAATKDYVDSVSQGLDIKSSVRAATTANITLSGTQTIDGVSLSAGNRVLVKNQSTGSENGIYVVATGAWSRATDADTNAEVTAGLFTFVEEGTDNQDSGWVLTTDGAITLGTTALVFTQFSGAGMVIAGAGLTKTGNQLDVVGNAGRIVVNANDVDLATVARTDTAASAGINYIASITTDSWGRVTATTNANVRSASTTQTGIVQLNNAVNSTSTTEAATANAVKTAYDLAAAALPLAGGTMTGKITLLTATTSSASLRMQSGTDPTTPVAGDIWAKSNVIHYYNGSATKVFAFTDSNITGTAANVTGTVAIANGGTGANNAASARTNLGATTVGANLFTLANPSAVRFLRVNADNSVSALSSLDTRIALDVPKFGNFIWKEDISSQIPAIGGVYTLANAIFTGSEHVYLNGVLMNPGASDDYVPGTGVDLNKITFNYTLEAGDTLLVSYYKDDASGQTQNQLPTP